MTKKDYELIAQWIKDYSYIAEIRREDNPSEVLHEIHWFRGAAQALAIRLGKQNSKFQPVKFAEMCGYDVNQLGI